MTVFDFTSQEIARRTASIETLHRIAMKSQIVRAHFDAWKHGSFPSFEEMLMQLVVALNDCNERLLTAATVDLQKSIPTLVVPAELCRLTSPARCPTAPASS